jgi:hypothetical protein
MQLRLFLLTSHGGSNPATLSSSKNNDDFALSIFYYPSSMGRELIIGAASNKFAFIRNTRAFATINIVFQIWSFSCVGD